ncbi:undecaprenyl diphosphate synthase [Natronocella acetinitrilica]|uniref:Ditrans,polycis-undecaprenyl-diphosphate synthase ((2E,6E)-farnesyl-diphosphate specific) n=1 Tax=Natronocella acetinitrilica TaxID=414046 RepID=A0AAE3G5A1_9GAMM|nr:polyprenyl diphosphate synthase [Natronocella acetinitrilica]MCP1676150.1 undecaprenyl diphosphate synthase [Natronocella acetinitrilica]
MSKARLQLDEDPDQGVSGPDHVAVVMDGNGRWASRRFMPRPAGHRAGVEAARRLIEACGRKGVKVLTLFAFSSENWRRPEEEVSVLMDLFLKTLEKEADKLHEHRVRIRLVGERERLGERLCRQVERVEELTRNNDGMTLVVAASYGGRWDITQAAKAIAARVAAGELDADAITEEHLSQGLALADLPPPDLLIRTGGEQRISNFLLWQLAYAELYFTPTLWPDFDVKELDQALAWYHGRERRFGLTSEQLGQASRA